VIVHVTIECCQDFSNVAFCDSGLRRGKFRNRGNQDSGYSESFDSETGSVQYLKLVTGTVLDQAHNTTPLTPCLDIHDLSPSAIRMAFVKSEDVLQHSFPISFSSVTCSTGVSNSPPTPPPRPRPLSNFVSSNRRPVSPAQSDYKQTVDDSLFRCVLSTTMDDCRMTAATNSSVDDCPPKPPPRPLRTLRQTHC